MVSSTPTRPTPGSVEEPEQQTDRQPHRSEPRRDPVPRVPETGAVQQLLRSAVTLQAEDLMRTIGALAMQRDDVRQWSTLVERDVRDLSFLATCAVAAGAGLPAGLDGGGGDPEDPGSAIEGLLASHEALMGVLRQVVRRAGDPQVRHVARDVLDRREEEASTLRSLGAGQGLPAMERLVHGTLAKYQS